LSISYALQNGAGVAVLSVTQISISPPVLSISSTDGIVEYGRVFVQGSNFLIALVTPLSVLQMQQVFYVCSLINVIFK
jgi:hypothetical protein